MRRPLSSNHDAGRAGYDDDDDNLDDGCGDDNDVADDDDDDDVGGDGVKPVVALLETTRSTRASVHEGKAGQCSLN